MVQQTAPWLPLLRGRSEGTDDGNFEIHTPARVLWLASLWEAWHLGYPLPGSEDGLRYRERTFLETHKLYSVMLMVNLKTAKF